MKKALRLALLPLVGAVMLLAGCATTSVARVDPNSQIDLSGYWNDTDVRMVCTNLINQCLSSPGVTNAIAKWQAAKGTTDNPSVKVGTFRNKSMEHIDTSIITTNMQGAIINSGKLDFVADNADSAELRAEAADQNSGNASDDSAAQLGDETGATYLLQGTVNSIVDKSGKTAVRSYFVDATLTDVQSHKIIWQGTDNSIKKYIKQANARF
jgi:uncharacterized protein (TIGR02722 family)